MSEIVHLARSYPASLLQAAAALYGAEAARKLADTPAGAAAARRKKFNRE
jgi:hypothetical protein